jgi:hypothetical protein
MRLRVEWSRSEVFVAAFTSLHIKLHTTLLDCLLLAIASMAGEADGEKSDDQIHPNRHCFPRSGIPRLTKLILFGGVAQLLVFRLYRKACPSRQNVLRSVVERACGIAADATGSRYDSGTTRGKVRMHAADGLLIDCQGYIHSRRQRRFSDLGFVVSAPDSKGWHARDGDPEGVLRWYDGRQWTPRISGGHVQAELTRLRRALAANPSANAHLQHQIQALTNEVARISEADGLGRGYASPVSTGAGRSHDETEALWATLTAAVTAAAGSGTPGRRWATRGLDAACYIVTGIAILVAAVASPGGHVLLDVAAGGGCIGYGGYIASTRRSYWVSAVTYLIPVLGLFWLLAGL